MAPRGNTNELTRETVTEAAAELVAEHGYGALNMRALAERFGVAPMTLYRHVRDKEDLLGALADRSLGLDLELPEPGAGTWQEELAAICRATHRWMLAHPELGETSVRQPVAGPAAYRGAEAVLGALERGGIRGDAAVSAFAALLAFTQGFTLQQIRAASTDRLGQRLATLETLPRDEYPRVREIGSAFLARESDTQFEDGLATLLEGLAARASAARG